MNKFASLIVAITICFSYLACSSGPPQGSCPKESETGQCCLKQSDCVQESTIPDENTANIELNCHSIDPAREPLLCMPAFDRSYMGDCIILQNIPIEACKGADDQLYLYNVWCCK